MKGSESNKSPSFLKIINRKEKQKSNKLIKPDSPIDFNEMNSSFKKVYFNPLEGKTSQYKNYSCTCEKSKCLKKYCDCFANGELCSTTCQCFDCRNLVNYANDSNISNKINAKENLSENSKTILCTCTRSNCIKNYCDCYKANMKCTPKCRCIDCRNSSSTMSRNKESKQKMIIEYFRIEIMHGDLKYKEGKVLFNKTMPKVITTENKNSTNNMMMEEEMLSKKRLCS